MNANVHKGLLGLAREELDSPHPYCFGLAPLHEVGSDFDCSGLISFAPALNRLNECEFCLFICEDDGGALHGLVPTRLTDARPAAGFQYG